jgi:hypothetical protein
MSGARVTYWLRPDAMLESERNALPLCIASFFSRRVQAKRAVPCTAIDDAMKVSKHARAT